MHRGLPAIVMLALVGVARPALAQHTDDNAVTSAEDAFGTVVGRESIGVYNDQFIRGFNPGTAGNIRIEGLYFDIEGCCTNHLIDGETIRVGPAAQGYAFPAPTGIADLTLKSSGDRLVISPIVAGDSFGSISAEFDAAVPLASGLSTAIGAGAYHNYYANGGGSKRWNFAAVPRWKPAKGIELIGFFNREQTFGDTQQGTYETTGDFMPARVPRAIYPGPAWVRSNYYNEDFGLVGRAKLGEWTLRAGLFRSLNRGDNGFSNNITVYPDGSGTRQIAVYPWGESASWSGELRASRRIAEGKRQHLLTVSLRGRDVLTAYGNSAYANTVVAPDNPLPAPIGAVVSFPEPPLNFAPLTANRTHQLTLGLSYHLKWAGLGEMIIGAQRTRYIKDVATPCTGAPDPMACVADAHSTTNLWLPSFSAAAPLTKRLSAYGSFVKGLEDSGTAPSYASNANQLLPATHSRQWDAGLKWAVAKQSTLILGVYDISKPYFNLDQAGAYGILGQETHKGIEVSLTASPAKDLTLVFGGNFERPRVVAAPNIGQAVGKLPVGQNLQVASLNLNYKLPFAPAITLDSSAFYIGKAAATVDNVVTQPGRMILGLGLRYNFKLGKAPATFRVSAKNLANNYTWTAIGSGTYIYDAGRSVSAYLTADL